MQHIIKHAVIFKFIKELVLCLDKNELYVAPVGKPSRVQFLSSFPFLRPCHSVS